MAADLHKDQVIRDLTLLDVPEDPKAKVTCKCRCGTYPVKRDRAQLRKGVTSAVYVACKKCTRAYVKRLALRSGLGGV